MLELLLAAALTPAFAAEPLVAVSTPTAMLPPEPPRRDGKPIESTPALAADLHRTLTFLESGREYYKAFTSATTHTSAENKAFLKFLEAYERELGNAKKELAALKSWLEKNAELSSRE